MDGTSVTLPRFGKRGNSRHWGPALIVPGAHRTEEVAQHTNRTAATQNMGEHWCRQCSDIPNCSGFSRDRVEPGATGTTWLTLRPAQKRPLPCRNRL
jgi:hypothetical protein